MHKQQGSLTVVSQRWLRFVSESTFPQPISTSITFVLPHFCLFSNFGSAQRAPFQRGPVAKSKILVKFQWNSSEILVKFRWNSSEMLVKFKSAATAQPAISNHGLETTVYRCLETTHSSRKRVDSTGSWGWLWLRLRPHWHGITRDPNSMLHLHEVGQTCACWCPHCIANQAQSWHKPLSPEEVPRGRRCAIDFLSLIDFLCIFQEISWGVREKGTPSQRTRCWSSDDDDDDDDDVSASGVL